MTKHRDNDNPNHGENSVEFSNIHGRKNPAIHDFSSIVMATDDNKLKPMATDDNKLKQNNKAMLAGRP